MVNLFIDGYPVIIYEWCLLALVSIVVAIRLYVQLSFRRKPWREAWIVLAWLFYFACTINDSLLNDMNYYNYTVDPTLKTDEELAPVMKIAYSSRFFYNASLYCCKTALLCLYGDITQKRSKTWWAVVIAWPCIIVGALFQILRSFLECTPMHLNWTFSRSFTCSTKQTKYALNTTSWSLHIFTDLIVYILPFFILAQLCNLAAKQKRAAYTMFALGFFNIGCAIVLFTYITFYKFGNGGGGNDWALHWEYAMSFLMPFQQGSALVIVCVPYLRRLRRGTRAKDLRPELETGNIIVHHRAAGMDVHDDVESGLKSTESKGSDSEGEVLQVKY